MRKQRNSCTSTSRPAAPRSCTLPHSPSLPLLATFFCNSSSTLPPSVRTARESAAGWWARIFWTASPSAPVPAPSSRKGPRTRWEGAVWIQCARCSAASQTMVPLPASACARSSSSAACCSAVSTGSSTHALSSPAASSAGSEATVSATASSVATAVDSVALGPAGVAASVSASGFCAGRCRRGGCHPISSMPVHCVILRAKLCADCAAESAAAGVSKCSVSSCCIHGLSTPRRAAGTGSSGRGLGAPRCSDAFTTECGSDPSGLGRTPRLRTIPRSLSSSIVDSSAQARWRRRDGAVEPDGEEADRAAAAGVAAPVPVPVPVVAPAGADPSAFDSLENVRVMTADRDGSAAAASVECARIAVRTAPLVAVAAAAAMVARMPSAWRIIAE